jgi:uncharacterized protein (TIGR01777 family)
MKTKILITGASGMIGKTLTPMLLEAGYEVAHLSRHAKPNAAVPTFVWKPDQFEMDSEALTGVDYVIHLAGAGIADKNWSKARKKLIIDSRTQTTETIGRALAARDMKLKGFISASGINFYGTATTELIHTETDPPGNDFTAECVIAWEKSVDAISAQAERTIKLRISLVLGLDGGALVKLAKPIKMGFGAAIGSGKQFVPWIHVNDVCRLFVFLLEHPELSGVFNGVAPEHVTNKGLTKAIAKQLNKSLWLPNVPSFLMRIFFGEMASLVLNGSRASSELIQEKGFDFQHPTLESALKNLYEK